MIWARKKYILINYKQKNKFWYSDGIFFFEFWKIKFCRFVKEEYELVSPYQNKSMKNEIEDE